LHLVFNVLQGCDLPERLNETFLCLVPKVENPQCIVQLRPVGLCNVAYKVVNKTSVNHLKLILSKTKISDNIIIMQEMLHTMRRKQGKVGDMEVKLGLETAYDRFRWLFIRQTLLEARLPQLMKDFIMKCVTLTTFSISQHGMPTKSFTLTSGVRQRDPLSPYLFVLYLETLNSIIANSLQSGSWRPIYASS